MAPEVQAQEVGAELCAAEHSVTAAAVVVEAVVAVGRADLAAPWISVASCRGAAAGRRVAYVMSRLAGATASVEAPAATEAAVPGPCASSSGQAREETVAVAYPVDATEAGAKMGDGTR